MAVSNASNWAIREFGDVAVFRNGLNYLRSNSGASVRVIGVSDFQQYFRISYDQLDTVQVSDAIAPDSYLRNGDLLFVRSNGNKALIGRCILIENLSEPTCFSGFTIRARIADPQMLAVFAGIYFQSEKARSAIHQAGEGSQISNLSQEVLASVKIPVPPLPEQRAIVGALNDVDALLDGLDQLIAKKCDLKQAAIQQLLTGQTRLPGFHGEWKTKSLGELFHFSGGYSASRDQLSAEGHCYLHYGDIHGATKTFVDVRAQHQDIPKLDIPLKRVSTNSLLADGDVVFVDASEDDAGTSKHVVVVNKENIPFISGLHTIVAKSKTDELAHAYRRYCFQTSAIRQQFLFYAVGTKVSGISKTNIAKLTIPVPTVPEQTAIAEVLTDMDAELTALEQRREKTRVIKQGMMQELLTGKTRLK